MALPSENHAHLVLTAYCYVFLEACPKLDQMTNFGFHGKPFQVVLGCSKVFFLQKPLTKDTAQMTLFWSLMKVQILK